ncbi:MULTISPECIES: hypothetical protein [Bacillaceae]|uniref:Uncharacterized protein n=1 Tax=Pseudobacillus wudalianchiensis TaxID=1743143 RepID=A0A1B9AU55_9BACI|nr:MULTISPECIES: hypothetical protein [Bacillus]KMY53158.1 hypothetical protein AC623_03480 [Bacillus sp. FJAT-27231]OCA87417.1 hypothetical protein A8F95_09300 [Bacillus wudalianchiensis]
MDPKQKGLSFLPDTEYEGKDQAYIDIDRMINEGLSRGTVHMRDEALTSNIEEAAPFPEETPPNE